MIEQALLSNTSLSILGLRLGIGRCVILNDGTHNVSRKTMACTVEAILGAVYLDGGMEALQNVLAAMGVAHEYLHTVTVIQSHFSLNGIP